MVAKIQASQEHDHGRPAMVTSLARCAHSLVILANCTRLVSGKITDGLQIGFFPMFDSNGSFDTERTGSALSSDPRSLSEGAHHTSIFSNLPIGMFRF